MESFEDRRAESEADAAGAEAAGIGGPGGDEDTDPAREPVEQAGGGEAEGFEQAERDLVENASHGEGDPGHGFTPEAESDRSDAEYGEADEVESSETRPEDSEGPESA